MIAGTDQKPLVVYAAVFLLLFFKFIYRITSPAKLIIYY